MFKIYRGKRYDTSTAKEICKNSSDALYLKRTGEYFVVENDKTLKLLTETEAQAFAKANTTPDEYKKFFAAESGNTTISATISTANYKKIKSLALSQNRSVSDLLNRMIEQL